MDRSTADSEKDDQDKEELLFCSSEEDMEAVEDNSLYKGLVRKVEQGHVFMLNFRKSHTGVSCILGSFLRHIQSLDNPVSKQMLSSDEKYLCCCLELIYNIGPKAASLNMGILSEKLNSIKVHNASTFEFTRPVVKCSLIAGPENVDISSTGDWILGTVTKSNSVKNMLYSSLFSQLGPENSNVKFGRTSLISGREPSCFDHVSSPSGVSTSSPQTVQKGFVVHGDHRNESKPVHKRLDSVSSTNSTCSDQSSLAFASVYGGMLQCTWKNGLPHYVFSIDDQRQVFVANLNKVDSSDNKVLDYVYSFHSNGNKKKGLEIGGNETSIVGQMKVSTSFTLCPNNRKVMETHFVLYGSIDRFNEMQTSRPTHRKKGVLPKMFVDASKIIGLSKHRNSSKIRGTSATLEDSFWYKSQDSCKNLDPLNKDDISENSLPPYLELAAIIVKDHVQDNHDELGIGGWGLKFLKKLGISSESSMLPKCCVQNSGDCSTSMEVLIPAGLHGGPRNRDGGPSSLIERWSSGGLCDCGGWDLGCPLTILNTRPSKKEVFPKPDMTGASESVDLFIQGSQVGVPIMKMLNIHDGLYCINFQSTLSALQSFAIAAAIIHTRTSIFNPKMYGS